MQNPTSEQQESTAFWEQESSHAGRARLDGPEKAVESHSEVYIMFVVAVTSILWSSEDPPWFVCVNAI